MNNVLMERLGDVKETSLKFATMFIVSRVLAQQPLNDQEWIKASVLTLVGFAVFDALLVQVFDPKTLNMREDLRAALCVVLKVGTMLVVSRALSGQSLNDQKWRDATFYTLLGFALYPLATKKLLSGVSGLGPKGNAVVSDVLEFGTALTVSRVMANGSLADPAWLKETMLTLVGFTVYDLVVA